MGSKMKKVLPALAVTFATLTSVVCAVDDMQMRNLENRVSALEQRRGANGMINPPAHPVVRDGIDLWIQVEALYMHATEDGLAYSIKNNTGTGLDGRVKNVNYNWDWGFRAGAGYNFDHDGWDFLVNYTWFQSDEKKDEKVDGTQTLWPTKINVANGGANVGPTASATFSQGHGHLHISFLDFELGREFFVSKWLTLRPFVGARAGWLNRNFSYEYIMSTTTATGNKIEGHNHNRFRAGGLRSGLNTQWGLGSGWSIFGDLALSLLYGTQRLHDHQDDKTTGVRLEHVHNSWETVRPMLDLALGLRWDHLFGCNDSYRLRIQLGWEQTTLFGFEKDMNFVSSTQGKFTFNQGDLSLSGLALQFRFDF
jgi:hypothetical protein